MVEAIYKIEGMTCGSCAMKIEKAINSVEGVRQARVEYHSKTLSVTSEQEIDPDVLRRALKQLGRYSLAEAGDTTEPPIYSILVWGIGGAIMIIIVFYFIQVLGMQDWHAPIEFMTDRWYLVSPLVLGFATQVGLFRAIHLLTKHGGGGVVAGSGSVSGVAMIACCMHNIVPLFPILGVSGLATFFAAYQTQMFLVSISVSFLGVGYMIWKYYSIKRACAMHHH